MASFLGQPGQISGELSGYVSEELFFGYISDSSFYSFPAKPGQIPGLAMCLVGPDLARFLNVFPVSFLQRPGQISGELCGLTHISY